MWSEEIVAGRPALRRTPSGVVFREVPGTTTLTFRGNGKPGEDQLLDDFSDETRIAAAENPFGLAAMGSAYELCADVWIPGYADAPADARPRTGDGPRTVRRPLPVAGLRRMAAVALRHPGAARRLHGGPPGGTTATLKLVDGVSPRC